MNANGQQTKAVSKMAQRGSSAVEFAFVFPILFLLVYGVIVYSYIYVIQQSITYGAQQSAEAAVAVNPIPEDTLNARIAARVNAVAAQSIGWLPANQKARLSGINGTPTYAAFDTVDTNQNIVRVTVEFRVPGLFPSLELPFVGNVPPLPTRLRAQAIARI